MSSHFSASYIICNGAVYVATYTLQEKLDESLILSVVDTDALL